jgi:flagellar protein FlaG
MTMDVPKIQAPPWAVMPVEVTGKQQNLERQRELIQAVRALNKAELFGQQNELTFTFDRQSRRPLLRIVDRETKEVIRQIPPESVLRMSEQLLMEEG